MDEKNEKVEFVREDHWIDGPPIFHGGTVPAALAWMRELTERFYAEAITEKAAITEDTLRQLLSQMGTHLAK